jgi:DsbC/DsbD-like thiol-disulfide interchange protein
MEPDLISRFFAAAAAVLFLSLPASAQTLQGEMMVDASLVSDRASVAPGETFHLGLHQDIEEGWHTYWRNPGDSGEATRIFLDLPEGWSEAEIIWPAPRPYNLGPLTNYGYSGEVTLPVPVTVPADAQPGMLTITGEATWLVCEDICIPEEDRFEITIEVGESAADAEGEALIRAALASAPEVVGDARSGLRVDDGRLILTVNGDFLVPEAVRGLYFFPFEGGVLDHNAEQPYTIEAGEARLDTRPGFLTRSGVNEVRAGALVELAREEAGYAAHPGVRRLRDDQVVLLLFRGEIGLRVVDDDLRSRVIEHPAIRRVEQSGAGNHLRFDLHRH